jgi:lipopolysaccharide biosynthesis glycosyltransferase
VSTTALYKLDIINILSGHNKVIYIDSDMLIQKDLAELYSMDLTGLYSAGVKDIKCTLVYDCARRWNLPGYFNSGMLVLNLKKMRADKMFEHMMADLRAIKKYSRFMDQDISNVSMRGKVLFLSPTYNYITTNLRFSIRQQAAFWGLSKEKMWKIIKSPAIIHYASPRKPWANYFAPYSNIWYKYYKLSPYANIPLKRRFFTQKDLLLIPRILYKLGLTRR